jgi:hypothetical protein
MSQVILLVNEEPAKLSRDVALRALRSHLWNVHGSYYGFGY